MTLSGQEINSFRDTDFDGNYSRYTDLLKILQHEKFTKRESYFYLRTDKSDDAEMCFSVSKTSSPPASPFFPKSIPLQSRCSRFAYSRILWCELYVPGGRCADLLRKGKDFPLQA
jgi:hypothetical protein